MRVCEDAPLVDLCHHATTYTEDLRVGDDGHESDFCMFICFVGRRMWCRTQATPANGGDVVETQHGHDHARMRMATPLSMLTATTMVIRTAIRRMRMAIRRMQMRTERRRVTKPATTAKAVSLCRHEGGWR